jgi:hypothetical protein
MAVAPRSSQTPTDEVDAKAVRGKHSTSHRAHAPSQNQHLRTNAPKTTPSQTTRAEAKGKGDLATTLPYRNTGLSCDATSWVLSGENPTVRASPAPRLNFVGGPPRPRDKPPGDAPSGVAHEPPDRRADKVREDS